MKGRRIMDDLVDKHLDLVLKASGSALRHYTMRPTLDAMRLAMRDAMSAPGVDTQDGDEIFHAVIHWMVKRHLLDLREEYDADDIIKALNDLHSDIVAASVEKVDCVTYESGFREPADPIWRIVIDGCCADFETETGARNFAAALSKATGGAS